MFMYTGQVLGRGMGSHSNLPIHALCNSWHCILLKAKVQVCELTFYAHSHTHTHPYSMYNCNFACQFLFYLESLRLYVWRICHCYHHWKWLTSNGTLASAKLRYCMWLYKAPSKQPLHQQDTCCYIVCVCVCVCVCVRVCEADGCLAIIFTLLQCVNGRQRERDFGMPTVRRGKLTWLCLTAKWTYYSSDSD